MPENKSPTVVAADSDYSQTKTEGLCSNRDYLIITLPGFIALEVQMLHTGKQIRLTRREIERFTKITGFEPEGIRCLADLDAYVKRCKQHYWGVSADTQFLHWLIEKEYQGCLGESAGKP